MRSYIRCLARPLAMSLIIVFSITGLFAANYVWEGENVGKLSGKAFKVKKYVNDPAGKVSQNKVLLIEKGPPEKKVARDSVNYRVNIPAAGKYYLWARLYWTSGCGNSFWLSVNGSSDRILGGDGSYDALHWICLTDAGKPLSLKLKKGVATFTLKSREWGTRVDQFYLTTDAKTVPQSNYSPTPNLIAK